MRCTYHVLTVFQLLHSSVTGDVKPPEIKNCPSDVTHLAEAGRSETVHWVEPSAQDNVGTQRLLFQSHKPGDTFSEGKTQVTYYFEDSTGNRANCSFAITIEGKPKKL